MILNVGDQVKWRDRTVVIQARVRPEDDPRKCVPQGFQFRGGDRLCELPRNKWSYLVSGLGESRLVWIRGPGAAALVPVAPVASHAPLRRAMGALSTQAAGISDGTMAALTGIRESDAIRRMRTRFVQHVVALESNGLGDVKSWLCAWRWFLNTGAIEEMPAYSALDRLFVLEQIGGDAPELRWASPGGRGYVSSKRPPGTLEELHARHNGEIYRVGELVRVGIVRRHWLVGKQSEEFSEWTRSAVGAGRVDA